MGTVPIMRAWLAQSRGGVATDLEASEAKLSDATLSQLSNRVKQALVDLGIVSLPAGTGSVEDCRLKLELEPAPPERRPGGQKAAAR